MVDHTIFRTPTKMGKGVLAVKTVDGNILLGPTSEDIEDKQNTAVTAAGLKTVAAKETEFFDHVPLQMAITRLQDCEHTATRVTLSSTVREKTF